MLDAVALAVVNMLSFEIPDQTGPAIAWVVATACPVAYRHRIGQNNPLPASTAGRGTACQHHPIPVAVRPFL
jgi:hypothetical protein